MAKWTAFALVLIVVARMFAGQFGQIDWSTVHLGPLCAAAGACLVAMHALNTRALHRALSAMAKGPSPMSVFAVMGVSRMGKYVPGKMMTLAGTIYLFHRHNVGPAVTGAAVLSNSVISVIVGLVVSAPLMLWPPVARHISEVANIPLTVYNALAWPVAVATVLAGIAALHPKVLRWGCNLALRWLKRPPLALFPGFRDYVVQALLLAAQWVAAGASMYFLALDVMVVPPSSIWYFGSAMALATTLGFLALFAPGGLGVREGLLLVTLAPIVGGDMAAVLSLGSRLVLLVVDALLALFGLAYLRLRQPGMPDDRGAAKRKNGG